MFLIDPRKIDIAFKAETLVEWDMADANFGWHRIATTEQYKLGVVQGRVIMLIHPTVELKPIPQSVKEYADKKEAAEVKSVRGRRK